MHVTYEYNMIDNFNSLKTLKQDFVVSFQTDSKLDIFMMICVEKKNITLDHDEIINLVSQQSYLLYKSLNIYLK